MPRAYIDTLPSGRHRGIVRPAGRKSISKTFDYRYEAEQFIADTLDRLDRAGDVATTATGTPPERAHTAAPREPERPRASRAPVVSAQAADWLNRRSRTITGATAGNYRRAVATISTGPLGRARLDLVRRADVELWLADLDEDDTALHTVRLAIKVLRMIYRDALVNELVWRDPTAGIPLPTGDIRPDRTLTRAEESRLLLAGTEQGQLFFLLGLDAGLRWGEAAGLTALDVDLDSGFVTVRQVVERHSGMVRGYPKSHRARKVPLTDRVVAALAAPVESAAAARGLGGLLFATSKTGRQLGYDNWRRDLWYPARAAAALADPQPRYHDLRHTYGTRLAAAGMPRKEIAVLMGHADERTTGRYLHAADDGARARAVRAALAV